VLEVAPDLRLRVTGQMPPLAPELDAVVERHWREASRERALFNGQVFCADRIGPQVIEGHWTEYRRAVAQMADPGLRDVLRIRSLAVCGVLRCRDGVAVGRRERASVYQAGLWQLPPAGSVDAGAAEPGGASWRRALLGELREELGIGEAGITELRPLCLVQHPSGVLDLGIEIVTALSGAEVLEAHRGSGNREYEKLLVVDAAEAAARVAAEGGRLVESAFAFLNRIGAGAS
jgi:8-oxo-dGTP pyrophosphatase MutT (NUDIX family)